MHARVRTRGDSPQSLPEAACDGRDATAELERGQCRRHESRGESGTRGERVNVKRIVAKRRE